MAWINMHLEMVWSGINYYYVCAVSRGKKIRRVWIYSWARTYNRHWGLAKNCWWCEVVCEYLCGLTFFLNDPSPSWMQRETDIPDDQKCDQWKFFLSSVSRLIIIAKFTWRRLWGTDHPLVLKEYLHVLKSSICTIPLLFVIEGPGYVLL